MRSGFELLLSIRENFLLVKKMIADFICCSFRRQLRLHRTVDGFSSCTGRVSTAEPILHMVPYNTFVKRNPVMDNRRASRPCAVSNASPAAAELSSPRFTVTVFIGAPGPGASDPMWALAIPVLPAGRLLGRSATTSFAP